MKKVLWLCILVVALLAVTAVPAMAGGDNNQYRWQGSVFGAVGQVMAVDADAGTITVQVYAGNRLVKDHIGQELTITTNEDTLFLRYGDPKCEAITFDEIEVGDYASMNGIVVSPDEGNDVFLAKRVTVDVPLQGLI